MWSAGPLISPHVPTEQSEFETPALKQIALGLLPLGVANHSYLL